MNSFSEYYKDARKKYYAMPAFNFESYDILEGIIMGAKRIGLPVIAQITPASLKVFDLEELCYMFEHMKKRYDAKVLLHLDHGENIRLIKQCINMGFDSVMIETTSDSFENNMNRTKEIVQYAHEKNVLVEANIGKIGDDKCNSFVTKIQEAIVFVHETQPDALAVSIGNVHGGRCKNKKLDFGILKRLYQSIEIPMVLHGSSGVINSDIEKSIRYGICKINIETEGRISIKESILTFYNENPNDIRMRNMIKEVKEEFSKLVEEKCSLFRKSLIEEINKPKE